MTRVKVPSGSEFLIVTANDLDMLAVKLNAMVGMMVEIDPPNPGATSSFVSQNVKVLHVQDRGWLEALVLRTWGR